MKRARAGVPGRAAVRRAHGWHRPGLRQRLGGLRLRPRHLGDPDPQRPGLGHPRGRPRMCRPPTVADHGLDDHPGQSILIHSGTSSVGWPRRSWPGGADDRPVHHPQPGRAERWPRPARTACSSTTGSSPARSGDTSRWRRRRARVGRNADAARHAAVGPGPRGHVLSRMLSNQWTVHKLSARCLPTGVRLTAYKGDAADLPPQVLQDFLEHHHRRHGRRPDRPRVPVRPDRGGAHRHGAQPGQRQARRHDMRSLPMAGGAE